MRGHKLEQDQQQQQQEDMEDAVPLVFNTATYVNGARTEHVYDAVLRPLMFNTATYANDARTEHVYAATTVTTVTPP